MSSPICVSMTNITIFLFILGIILTYFLINMLNNNRFK